MQSQDVHPYGTPEQASPTSPADAEGGHKKKSVMGKVKDKARKLKTKVKKPKSPGGTGGENGSSSSDSSSEEGGSDPHQQPGVERDAAVAPGLKGEAYEAIPDPHTDTTPGLGDKFGQMKLADERDPAALKEQVPSAPGQASAGGLGYSAKSGQGVPVQEGKNPEGEDLVAKPDKDWTKDDVAEGAAAAAATGVVATGLKSHADKDSTDHDLGETPSESKPSITSRAADTATGLKDTIASKAGYGPGGTTTAGGNASGETTGENKSLLQTLQESAAGATAAISSKLGYGDSTSPSSQAGAVGGDGKPYTQKISEAAVGAKDAVASQLGYGGTTVAGDSASGTGGSSYLQQARDAAIGAKDTVASKMGYGSTDEQSIPEGTATRFHPGEEDKALSMLITEKMSTGATAVKDTLMKPFAGKSGPPTPTSDEAAGKATEDLQAQTPAA